MTWFVALVAVVAVAAFMTVRIMQRRRPGSGRPVRSDTQVTLSVLPSRTAVVMLERGVDAPSAALNRLVEHAVREAFVFRSVDIVEVRKPDGQLLDRRRRPLGQRPSGSTGARYEVVAQDTGTRVLEIARSREEDDGPA